MEIIFENIKMLKDVNTLTKHEQLVRAVTNAIESKGMVKGDRLPSINKMVAEIGYARKTIVKAYEELKGRGIVESKNFKGYYIADVNTGTKLRVALLLYAYHSFQEDFYNTFRDSLGGRYVINIFFHHNNLEIFKDILERIKGRYGMYVVAPIQKPEVKLMLETIPSDKLLVVDRYVNMPNGYSFISQEFESNTYNIFEKLLPRIKKYDEFILFYKKDSDYPEGICQAFKRFIKDFDVSGTIEKEYKSGSVKKRTLYFFINDNEMWTVLKDCKNKNLKVGVDVGILSTNDDTVKEIVFGGITTISTDFKKMAKEAAEFVKDRQPVKKIVSFDLLERQSI